jgi:hypothetical protein
MTTTGPFSGPVTLTAIGNPSTVSIVEGTCRTLHAFGVAQGRFGVLEGDGQVSGVLYAFCLALGYLDERLWQRRFRRRGLAACQLP